MTQQEPRHHQSESELLQDAIRGISKALMGQRDLLVDLTGISMRAPKDTGEELLLVIRGVDAEGMHVVAFHSAFSLAEALRGLAARLSNGTLRWREDGFR